MEFQKINLRYIPQNLNNRTTHLEIEMYDIDDLEIIESIESDDLHLNDYPNLNYLTIHTCIQPMNFIHSLYSSNCIRPIPIITKYHECKLFIPENIRTIKFIGSPYAKIYGKSSQNIDHLIFDSNYNYSNGRDIYEIFTNITKLTFDNSFNSYMKGSLHEIPVKSWRDLKNGDQFHFETNNIIGYNISNTVKYLTFGNSFNHKIDGCIPDKVVELSFGKSFNKSLANCNKSRTGLPKNLKCLTISNDCYELNKNYLTDLIGLRIIKL